MVAVGCISMGWNGCLGSVRIYMAIITSVTQPGGKTTSTLSGRIVFDESRGKIAITDNDANERTRLDVLGLTTLRANGHYSARYGTIESTGESVAIIALPNEDLKPIVGE